MEKKCYKSITIVMEKVKASLNLRREGRSIKLQKTKSWKMPQTLKNYTTYVNENHQKSSRNSQ